MALSPSLGGGQAEAEESAGPAVALPGPAPRARLGTFDADAENRACAACHVDIAAEWDRSMHRAAWGDPVFQSAYAIEQQDFCRGCHAPEADPRQEPDAAAARVGVACTTCHVEGGHIVGAGSSGAAPHGLVVDARRATAQACAGCHQFDFPGLPTPMQSTVAEHEASDFAGVSCQGCHMPQVAGANGATHRSHDFTVIGDPAMVRAGATVTASRTGSRTVVVEVGPGSAGHSFPTGDMFRRLEVRAVAVDATGREVRTADPVHLGRTFEDRSVLPTAHGTFSRRQLADTRVPAPGAGPARRVELHFDAPVSHLEVRWEVLYQRMDSAMAASFGVNQARDEIVVASGELASTGGTR